ncbi:MAG: Chorismate pyruvate-lyase [Gammaproteobacteria bacterium]|nr:Chorismate pyruvate-lyase [Gammaproteobacteria bacterium]
MLTAATLCTLVAYSSRRYARAWRVLSRLGNRPIGSVLFYDPGIRRGQLVYKKLDARHPLRHILVRNETLWASRSVFVRDKMPLIVNEVFMPEILRLA